MTKLNQRDLAVFKLIKYNPSKIISNKFIAERLDITDRGVYRTLDKLEKLKIIKRDTKSIGNDGKIRVIEVLNDINENDIITFLYKNIQSKKNAAKKRDHFENWLSTLNDIKHKFEKGIYKQKDLGRNHFNWYYINNIKFNSGLLDIKREREFDKLKQIHPQKK